MAASFEKIRYSQGGPLSTAERYLERALAAYSAQKYDEALLDLNEALRYERNNAELYATRGIVLLDMGQPEEAEKDFQKALKIDPSQWIIPYMRGKHAFENGNYDDAIAHFSQAQRFTPLRPEIYIYRAAAYYHKDEKKLAQQDIDSALQIMPSGHKGRGIARKWLAKIKKLP